MAVLSLQAKRNFLFVFSTVVVLCFLCVPSTHSAQVTLAWDPNTEPTIAGYKVHYGTLSGNYQTHLDAGLNTTYLVTNLPDGGTYYFAVTAYDSSATESGYSAEVSYSASAACTYAISPASQSIPSSGGAGTVSITAPAGCAWTAVSNSSWAILTSNSSGSANGTVNYSVLANPSTASRTGTMTIAGKTFTLNEAGLSCSYAISPAGQTFDSSGGSGSIAVTALSGCAWNALSNVSWISIVSGGTGSGNGSVNFSVATNSGSSSRTGIVTVGGKPFTVTQNGAPQYTLNVAKNGTGTGSVTSAPAGNTFVSGTGVTLTAAPDTGSTFAGWSGACTGTSPTCSVTMSNNLSATATFNLKTYTITANADANGTLSPSGTINVNYGAGQNFAVIPNAGYQVADVKVNGVSVGAVPSYNFANVTSNQTIQASFSAIGNYALTVAQAGTGGGTVSTDPTGTSFSAGAAVALTALPDGNSIFTGWSGACSGSSPTCTITMDSNKSVTATFSRKNYTITAVAASNGTITPPGSTSVAYRESKSFAITPGKGFRIADVKVDGISIGTPNNYTFGNVMADHSINASFAPLSKGRKK